MMYRPFLLAALAAGLSACAAQKPDLPPVPPMAQPAAAEQPAEAAGAGPESAISESAALSNVRAAAKDLIAAGTVSNMVVGVALPDGRHLWMREGTLAFDSDIPADQQSLYRIYSMTKPITGMAAAILISEGKLSLDQPVSDFIPAFRDSRVLADKDVYGETRPAARPVTIRHLLTHTSGLGYSIIPTALSEAYSDAGVVPGVRRLNPLRPSGPQPASLQEFAARVGGLPLRVDPGTEWSYSVGLDVMGAIIEKVSGMSFPAFLEQRIFSPVGMDDTEFVVPQPDAARLTTNYARLDGKIVPFDRRQDSEYTQAAAFPSAGAGLAGTAEDYLRYVEAVANGGMLNGEQVLPAAAVALATSDLLPEGVTFSAFGAEDQGFGAGARVLTHAAPGGEPVGAYGWGGAASTLAAAYPNQDIAFVMMTQLLLADEQTGPRARFAAALAADLAAMQTVN